MAWGPKQRPREATWETLHAKVGFFPKFGDAGAKFMSIDGTHVRDGGLIASSAMRAQATLPLS